MNCRELVEVLIDFVTNELPPDEHIIVLEHLERCPPCVAYVESYCLTIRLTRRLPCDSLPPHVEKKLEAMLADIQAKRGEATETN